MEEPLDLPRFRAGAFAMITDCASEEMTNIVWRGGKAVLSSRVVAKERPVAVTYNGSSYAVMMATPTDLEDFGLGFSLTEGIVERANEIISLELVETDLGPEIRMWLAEKQTKSLFARRRAIAGPVGCGLCGIESLEQACPAPRPVKATARFRARELSKAMNGLEALQDLNQKTRAVHAAAFWRPTDGIGPVREDVGRHNALDKLAGALVREGADASNGVVLLTSRVSVEMVQKTAMMGISVLVAMSAPTTLAVETAERAGITLVAVARKDGYEVFTHPDRLLFLESEVAAA